MNIDVIALQEPAIINASRSIAARDWISVYPTPHLSSPKKTRSLMLIQAEISMDSWNQLDFPSSNVTVVQFLGEWGKLTIFNIYNEGANNSTINLLTKYQRDNQQNLEHCQTGSTCQIWLGDFNRHHPYWDDPNDLRLFTTEALRVAKSLIEAVADAGLDLILPRGIPTHCHNVTKRWSRLDHMFITEDSVDAVTACGTLIDHRGINTDHVPVLTELNLGLVTNEVRPLPNFRDVDWDEFRKALAINLGLEPEGQIINQRQLDVRCTNLTEAIQSAIRKQVPVTEITSKSKRWWTKELTQMRKQSNKLGRKAYERRYELEHKVHAQRKEVAKRYESNLEYNKKHHWRDWLEKLEEPDIWTANRYVTAPVTDGGKARILVLKHKVDRQEVSARTNSKKSAILAKGFFPPKPAEDSVPPNVRYPKPCKGDIRITAEQIQRQLRKLKPYKAPGPDGIPNVVLTKCADLLTSRMLSIYDTMFERKLMYKPWKSFNTVVLRKPGKPRYDMPKAYRPIALLNTLWKVLTAVVAGQLTYMTEKHQLLLGNHFGGRPGHTTTDAMHLLANTIKTSWRAGKVTSVLFLDIEGAFPNAVPSRLEHNMRTWKVPRKIVDFIHNMLRGRVTALKFDGYMSEPISIDNGIGQGDPLSMGIYQYYNADLLDIPREKGKSAMAYIDDAVMVAIVDTFPEVHEKLLSMMTRPGGVTEWSTQHNSPLEYSKLALVDFAHRCSSKQREALRLPQIEIQPSVSTKYLGVIFDQNLEWKEQHARAIGRGTSWSMQIRRLARPSWGLTPENARRLYISVAIPRVLYALDIWCQPPYIDGQRQRGTGKITSKLATIQRSGALAITGGLRTSATDALDATAFLLPAPNLADKWCHRAAIRLAMLPKEHPLHGTVKNKITGKIKHHKSPLNGLLAAYRHNPREIEKIPVTVRNPAHQGILPFAISIAGSREDSIREAEHTNEEIQVYADGSAIDGKVGAAAVLTRAGHPPRALHLYMGPESEHTVHEAELVGILLALQLISTEKHSSTSFALGVDNQAVLKAFQSALRNPGHHIAREALQMANQVQKRRRKGNYKLTLRWTAGHEGIEGNEDVDREAKRAARGKSSDKKTLPFYLRKCLLINPAAVKQAHHKDQMKTWKEGWKASYRGKHATSLDESTPSKRFLKTISQEELGRIDASRIAQFRLEHAPVNQYLKRMKRVDSARCPACGDEEETAEHFMLRCPTYAHERWALAQQAKKIRKPMAMDTLLGIPEMAKAVAKYIRGTSRFSQTKENAQ